MDQNPNVPVHDPNDLSFNVMPTEGKNLSGGSSVSYKAGGSSVPPTPSQEGMPNSGGSSSSRKWLYYIIGLIVLLALGGVAYYMLGNKNEAAQQTVTTKLPKAWLTQYFNVETCADQATCGDDADPDKDGLKNYDEFKASTNPLNPDTDVDGLADGDEMNIYKTEPTLKYTDRREIVAQNNWTDGYQIKNGYDPLTPALPFTDLRKKQIADDTVKFKLHEPSITTTTSASGSTDQTASWKTYTNTSNSFEFKYPEELTLRQFNDLGKDEPISATAKSVGLKQGSNFIFLVGLPGMSAVSSQTIGQQFSASKSSDYTISSAQIAGINGSKVVFNSSVKGVVSDFYFVQTGTKVYELTVAKNNTIATQIFSTFKLTTTDQTANWKTYTNAKYKYEFKYPPTAKVLEQGAAANGFKVDINYEGREGFEPPRLSISNQADTRANLKLTSTNKFSSTTTDTNGENYINFKLDGTNVYANCLNYGKDAKILEFCNLILPTFKFTK